MRKIYIASDHAGFELKKLLLADEEVKQMAYWEDMGPGDATSTDYPIYAHKLCEKLVAEKSTIELQGPCAVLICGSGVGMSIAANRHKSIRAVLTWDPELAKLSRQHNASNVLCMGARFASLEQAKKTLKLWLESAFEGGRHETRINSIEK